ncbi:MAG: EamA family transporter [Candidatus Nanopelagicus sp.]
MIGEVASFSNALSNAFTNTLGGKSTQLSNWRNTLRYSSSIALVIICFVILFNFETLTLRVFALGFAAGFIGGLGLPFIYKAISTGAVSFVGPVVALTQSFFLIMFAVIVKNESLSLTFPIAAALGAVGIYLCSRQAVGNQPVTFSIFLLAATAAVFFSGFSFIATEIDNSQILGGLVGARFGVFALTFVFPPKKGLVIPNGGEYKKYALLSGTCEVVANIFFMIAINNLELSKVGIFMASAPALSTLIAIKMLHQRPSITNWVGIAASSGALAIIALS